MPRTAVTPDVKLFHTDVGAGRPVIFVHGGHMTHEIWRHQTAAVTPEYRAIAVDLRGHGGSDKPYCEYSLETFADDLLALIDRLDLDDVALVGWSLGAQIIAKCIGKRPDGIGKAVFVSSVLFDQTHPTVDAEIDVENLIDGQRFDQPGTMMDFVSSSLGDSVGEATKRWVWNVSMENPVYTGVNHLQSMREVDYGEIVALLRDVDVPALVVHGANDDVTSRAGAQHFASNVLRDGRSVRFENSNHFPFLAEVERFNSTLTNFLRQ